ncbi:MAG TPA: hypothetical protein DIW61_11200 [Candidatus Aminicenantes bacterium]|nr:hypothetical protein [Candidatus Aminicenantes bacterium]
MPRRKDKSFYFQEIARTFFSLRGAPFVLSSRDMVAISSWEERGIPLRIVLEGIERAFEKYRKRAVGGRKISSLSFCETEILRAHAEFRDRTVGRAEKGESREDKRKRIKIEVERFLKSLPPEAAFLGEVYREAQTVLNRREASEEALERLDARAEELITREADAAVRAEVEKRVRADFPGRPAEELRGIFLIGLVKRWREKFRVPYLSYFFY